MKKRNVLINTLYDNTKKKKKIIYKTLCKYIQKININT